MAHPLFDITGRCALVTGSSRGIGLALARGLAEAGARVVLNGRGVPALEAAAGRIRAETAAEVFLAPFDVTDSAAVAAAIARIESDIGPLDICVNALGPGYFETELTQALVADEEFSRWVRRRTPAGRWGRTEDLVGTLLYLASDASAFVNGQVIYVDGGMLSVL